MVTDRSVSYILGTGNVTLRSNFYRKEKTRTPTPTPAPTPVWTRPPARTPCFTRYLKNT